MLPKRTYQWECKANEKISLYEHSNECIEVNAYLTLIMKSKCAKANECGDKMIEANVKDESNLKWV